MSKKKMLTVDVIDRVDVPEPLFCIESSEVIEGMKYRYIYQHEPTGVVYIENYHRVSNKSTWGVVKYIEFE